MDDESESRIHRPFAAGYPQLYEVEDAVEVGEGVEPNEVDRVMRNDATAVDDVDSVGACAESVGVGGARVEAEEGEVGEGEVDAR